MVAGLVTVRRVGARAGVEVLRDGGSDTNATSEDLDLADPTFTCPDLNAFVGLDDHGLVVTGQHLSQGRAVLECRVAPVPGEEFCRRCGAEGRAGGTVKRRLAHIPAGWRPTTLLVRVRRFRCATCRSVWLQDTTAAAEPRAKLTRAALGWGLFALVVNHMSVSAVARALGVAWGTANDAILTEGQRVLISDPTRFDGVAVIGVDEHVWRHTRHGDKYVTVIIDLTPIRAGTGPARLLDMAPGRSKAVFKAWLDARDEDWKNTVQVVAMDGFTGFKTASAEALGEKVTTVMDPFHVVRLAGDALGNCRRRIQQQTLGRRGRKGDPLYGARRTLATGADLLTSRQKTRLENLFANEEHVAVEATWGIYQRMIAAYRHPDRATGRAHLAAVIKDLAAGVPAGLKELRTLGRTLKKRAEDVLAYFDHPGTSNGPTEAINGRLEHLRGSALGFRNLTHYIARSLLEAGGFRPRLHAHL